MYQRHCLVVTKNKFWSTIETDEPLNIIALIKACTVRLLYLGNLKFGTLHWNSRNLQPIQPKLNLGQFKIIEEYTLDDQTTSGEGSTTDNGDAQHVNTATPQVPTTSVPEIDAKSNEPSSSHMETKNDEDSLKVETSQVACSKDVPALDIIPFKKELTILLPRLKETEINVWSDTVHTYYTYDPPLVETEFKSVIASVCGYSLRCGHSGSHMQQDDVNSVQEEPPMIIKEEPVPKKVKNTHPQSSSPSPERLIAHANAIINKVSSFITKPMNAKYGNKGTVTTAERSN